MAQLDKASDYESEDWGFKSLQGYFLVFTYSFSFRGELVEAVLNLHCLDARVV